MANQTEPHEHVPLPSQYFEILVTLASGESHGYRIVKDIEERTDGYVSLGVSTLYAAVKRMVDDGLVEDAGNQSSERSGGPPRRYYRITDLGREVAYLEASRLRRAAGIVLEKLAPAPQTDEMGR
jgi:DNA-binding PadR family transcriptional regulator